MADAAILEAPEKTETVVETVDFRAPAESEWSKMTPAQQEKDVDKAISTIAERRGFDAPVEKEPAAEKPSEQIAPAKEPEAENTEETTADGEETPAAGDAAKPDKKGEGEGKLESDDDDAEWLDDAVREYATARGITDEELSEFATREEFDRALRIADRRAYEDGKAALKQAERKDEPPRAEREEERKAPPKQPSDPLADIAKIKLGEEFDEELAKRFNQFVDASAATIGDLRARLEQFEQQGRRQAADDIRRQAAESIHALGFSELFGKSGEKPTKEQSANLEKAIDAHFVHAQGLLSRGQFVAPTPEFLRAAVHLAFGDQLTKLEQKRITEKLRKQSARRTGGSAAKPLPKEPPANESQRERAQRIASDPDVQAAWNRLTADRG